MNGPYREAPVRPDPPKGFAVGDRVRNGKGGTLVGTIVRPDGEGTGWFVEWDSTAPRTYHWDTASLLRAQDAQSDHATPQTPAGSTKPTGSAQSLQAPRRHTCGKCYGPTTEPYEGITTREPSRCIREGGCYATREPDMVQGEYHGEPYWLVNDDRLAATRFTTRGLAITAWRTALIERARKESQR